MRAIPLKLNKSQFTKIYGPAKEVKVKSKKNHA
jgi:hypothetical protein